MKNVKTKIALRGMQEGLSNRKIWYLQDIWEKAEQNHWTVQQMMDYADAHPYKPVYAELKPGERMTKEQTYEAAEDVLPGLSGILKLQEELSRSKRTKREQDQIMARTIAKWPGREAFFELGKTLKIGGAK